MRDSEIFANQRANERRDGMILAQNRVIVTWQQAFEMTVKDIRILDVIRWLWRPAGFIETVHAQQQELLEQAKRDMAAAAEKPKIDIVPASAGVLNGR